MVSKLSFLVILSLVLLTFCQPEPAPAPVTPEPEPAPVSPPPEPSPVPPPEPAPVTPPEPSPVNPPPAPVTPEPEPAPVVPEPSPEPSPAEPAPLSPPEPAPQPAQPSPVGPEPAPVVPPQPSPAPVPPQVAAYVFDQLMTNGQPSARSSAVLATNSQSDTLYLLGGEEANGIAATTNYMLNLASKNWTTIPVTFQRTGACSSQGSYQYNSVYIFGGEPFGTINTQPFLSFNMAAQNFTALANPDAVPQKAAACASTVDQSRFYTFFGIDMANNTCSNIVARYTSQNNTWQILAIAGPTVPAGREYSAAAQYGDKQIIVFGGSCGAVSFNDIWRFDTDANTWTQEVIEGIPPTGRSGHSLVILGDTMYVYGGKDQNGNFLGDVQAYDLTNKKWKVLPTTTVSPTSRSDASAISLVNRFAVFGGQNGATKYADTWQFVSEASCLGQSCENCVDTAGCGWCSSNDADFRCVAGDAGNAFVAHTCAGATYTVNENTCPEDFPSWAIALIVIGGVVLIGIIIFAIMKVRSKGDYQEIH